MNLGMLRLRGLWVIVALFCSTIMAAFAEKSMFDHRHLNWNFIKRSFEIS